MATTSSLNPIIPAHDEQGLVSATRAGDDRAFEELYSRYRERIFAFIVSRVHDHGRAEDIAQDVFMSALRRLRATDQRIAFKPWIYEIAKNACIDEFRRGSRVKEVPLEAESDVLSDRPSTLSLVPTPAAAVESKQRMEDLRGAFGGLSENHHQLLVLRELEGRSYDEIGERLDMTRQMVESGLFRARRKLSEEYRELATGRRCQQVQLAIDDGALVSARALGLRDRRRFARHLSHCQGCRQFALLAGVDEALLKPRSVADKIAAWLPLPFSLSRLLPWPGGRGRKALREASHGGRGSSATGASNVGSSALQNVPTLAGGATGSAFSLSPVIVTTAALTVAGVGGMALHSAVASDQSRQPAHTSAAARKLHSPGGGSGGSAAAGLGSVRARSLAGTAAAGHRTVTSARGSGAAASATAGGHKAASKGSAGGAASTASAASKAIGGVTSTASKAVGGVAGAASNAVGGVTSTASKAVGGVAGTASNAVGGATNTASKAVGGVTNTASKAVGGVTNTASKAVGGVTNTASKAVGGTTGTASGAVGGVTSTGSNAASGAAGTASGAVGGATKTGSNTIQGAANTATGATSGSAPPPAGSGTGSSPTSTVSGAATSAGQATGQATQSITQTAGGPVP